MTTNQPSPEEVAGLAWRPFATIPADEPAADALIRLVCLDYGSWRPEDLDDARAVLAREPGLSTASIHAAAAVGDVAAVRAFLAADPSLAGQRGGPHGWVPLLYAAYSRLAPEGDRSTLEVARALLAAGADPDAGFLWEGNVPAFTALAGAFGEGEDGNNQPPHPERDLLARALLDAGADPNDGQTLYNRHFRADDGHLELLFGYGLGTDCDGPWLARFGRYLGTPEALLTEELWCAAKKNFPARVALLLAHGVPADVPGRRNGLTPYLEALAYGNHALAAMLVAAGATAVEPPADIALAAACVAGRDDDARAMIAARPGLLDELGVHGRGELLRRAVEARHPAGLRLMAALGFALDDPSGDTALHQAAWSGELALVELLLSLGASPDVRDPTFHARPIGWAHHNHQPHIVAALLPRADIFDALRCDGPDRVAALLDADPARALATDDDGDALVFYLHRGLTHLDTLIGLLVRHGADFTARHHTGQSLGEFLRSTRNHRVLDALHRAGLAA